MLKNLGLLKSRNFNSLTNNGNGVEVTELSEFQKNGISDAPGH